MSMRLIAEVALAECERQQVGLDQYVGLLQAHTYALNKSLLTPSLFDVHAVAQLIEPVKADRYRLTPVTFTNGGPSADADLIPGLMWTLFQNVHDIEDIDGWMKQFLWIHPFRDGNGRTGWVLYNWLCGLFDPSSGTLLAPAPLPDYFGNPQ